MRGAQLRRDLRYATTGMDDQEVLSPERVSVSVQRRLIGTLMGDFKVMAEEELVQIIEYFEADREFRVSKAVLDGGLDPLFPRLLRAALNQLCDGKATVSRYGIWANTVRDNIRQADKEMSDGNIEEAHRLMCRAANSLSAFPELQAHFDAMEIGET